MDVVQVRRHAVQIRATGAGGVEQEAGGGDRVVVEHVGVQRRRHHNNLLHESLNKYILRSKIKLSLWPDRHAIKLSPTYSTFKRA